jgi:hypothetical protein
MLERVSSEKHSSLFGPFLRYAENVGPCCLTQKRPFLCYFVLFFTGINETKSSFKTMLTFCMTLLVFSVILHHNKVNFKSYYPENS